MGVAVADLVCSKMTVLSRVLRSALLMAIASGVACGDAGTAPGAAMDRPDASVSDAASSVAPLYSVTGPWTVGTCEVAAALAPCAAPATPASDASAANALYVVFYPKELATGFKHPILTWGNGTGAAPGQYGVLLTHLASWGFVVVASTSPSTGTGKEMLAGEDYLVLANADRGSPFFGSLDVTAIGAVGHSQGADGAAQALLGADAPGSTHRFIKTVVPIELPAQQWTCFGDSDPSCAASESFDSKSLVHGSVFFVDGSKDTLIAPPTQSASASGEQSVKAYYDATPAETPRARGTLIGADHNDIQDHCTPGLGCAGVGPKGYLGYVTAWLVGQLRGDIQARSVFAGEKPEFDRDPGWQDQAQAGLP